MKHAVLLAIIALWTVVAFLYRFAARRNVPRNWVAAGAALVWFAATLVSSATGKANIFDAPRILWWVGLAGGISLVMALPFFMGAVARGNLAVSWTILTLGCAAVALASLLYPGERAKAAGVAGLLAASCAIAVLGWDSAAAGVKGGFARGWGVFMFFAFVTNAAAMYVMALAKYWGDMNPASHKMAFFTAQTAVFFAGSAALCALVREEGSKVEGVLIGAGVGLTLFAGNYGAMVALGNLAIPAYVFFPATTGGSTVTVALVSALWTRERPSGWGWLGLGVGVAALALLGGSA